MNPQQCYIFTHCNSPQIQICSIQMFSELHVFVGLLKCRECAKNCWKSVTCQLSACLELASALCVCSVFLLYFSRIRSSKWNIISVSTSSLILLHLGIISCFQSNLLKCCQQIRSYPVDIIWFPLQLTLSSYGEMISFSINISLILPYHMSSWICVQIFKGIFQEHSAISAHYLFLALDQCVKCKTNVSRFYMLRTHSICTQENEKHISLPALNSSLRFIQ